MSKVELGIARSKNDRGYSACEYMSSLSEIVLNAIKLMKKETDKLMQDPTTQQELANSLHVIQCDMLLIKDQIQEKASELADERAKLWKEENGQRG